MATEKRLIDANALLLKLKKHHDLFIDAWEGFSNLPEKDKARVDEISNCIADVFNAPTVDAVEVVHGRWALVGGDLHYNGYAVACTICNKAHFVHFKKSLGGLDLNELFELPNYCPNCGAKMDGGNKSDF